jgi:D-ribitol-5-phosphate cytidylyltransferase
MNFAGILAGGTGTRMGADKPKQFLTVNGTPILIHTVAKFLENNTFDKIFIVITGNWEAELNELLAKWFSAQQIERLAVIKGGVDRNESLLNAVTAAEEMFGSASDHIMVTHDVVRPFLTNAIIAQNIELASEYGVAGTALSAIDTIGVGNQHSIEVIPQRETMYQVQTPQSFNINKFKSAYANLSDAEIADLTEATKIFILNGVSVPIVRGLQQNFKITTPFDLAIAEAFYSEKEE